MDRRIEPVLAIYDPFPDFRIASAYEQWRNICLSHGESRAELATRLEQIDDDLALLRATQILSVDLPQHSRAFQLAGRLMCSQHEVLRLFGRYMSTFLVIRGSYQNDLEAPISAHAAIHTLHELLGQLDAMTKRDLLSFELEMRIHLSLAESYSVSEDFSAMQQHASKLVTLAPSVGMNSFSHSGKTLLARSLLYQGNATAALSIYEDLSVQPQFQAFHRQRTEDIATALLWSGNFIGAATVLGVQDSALSSSEALSDVAKGLLVMTLMYSPVSISCESLPNRFAVNVQAHSKLQEALQHSPFDEQRQQVFRAARSLIARSAHSQTTWYANFERSFATLCSLRAGDFGIALRSLPKIGDTEKQPLWVEALSLFVTLETALRVRQTHGKSDLYRSSIWPIQQLLTRTDALSLERFLPSLQLLTPYALAFVATLGGIDEIVTQAGMDCIVNLKTRPASVYGVSGLRPVQIAELTLEAFGLQAFSEGRAGGGQLEALSACLRRAFGCNQYWFEPVLPARLAVGLLEASSAELSPDWMCEACQNAAAELSRNFGLMPVLQKIVPPPVLSALETEISRALYGNPDPSRIWQVIRSQGGQL